MAVSDVHVFPGKFVTPFPKPRQLLSHASTEVLKAVGKEVTSNFSFSDSVFYPFGELFIICIINKIIVFKNFHLGRV